MNLSAKRLYFVLLGVSLLALVALLAGTYGADSLLKHKTKAVHDARLENLVLERQKQQLVNAKSDIKKYQELADIAKHIVPQDKDQAQTVREIVEIAAKHNIKLGSVTFPSSTLGDAKSQNSQLTQVKDISGVFSLDITVNSDSSSPALLSDFIAFLDALEHNRRTALASSISLQPSADNPNRLSFSLTLREYIKP